MDGRVITARLMLIASLNIGSQAVVRWFTFLGQETVTQSTTQWTDEWMRCAHRYWANMYTEEDCHMFLSIGDLLFPGVEIA